MSEAVTRELAAWMREQALEVDWWVEGPPETAIKCLFGLKGPAGAVIVEVDDRLGWRVYRREEGR